MLHHDASSYQDIAATFAGHPVDNLTERAYPNPIYFNELDRGNRVAAWQEPALFSRELRAAFRSLR
jgi:hypothetical protein